MPWSWTCMIDDSFNRGICLNSFLCSTENILVFVFCFVSRICFSLIKVIHDWFFLFFLNSVSTDLRTIRDFSSKDHHHPVILNFCTFLLNKLTKLIQLHKHTQKICFNPKLTSFLFSKVERGYFWKGVRNVLFQDQILARFLFTLQG